MERMQKLRMLFLGDTRVRPEQAGKRPWQLGVAPNSLKCHTQDGAARSGSQGGRATIGCEGEDDDDLIVSIMLPSPQAGDGERDNKSFTSVDELYVVAVRPAKEYVTYACSLQSPVLV